MLVGVDIGGTFTDLVLSIGGELRIHKLLSTPHDPAQAMLAGLAAISPGGLDAITQVAHGSTVATNAILERRGARTALITTQGFRDILAIGRQNRQALYALQPKIPTPLIPRQWCYEVPERLAYSGAVLIPLDMQALDRVLDAISAQSIESVAVCFLYSYVNPAHERAVRARILERGLLLESQVALSCEVLPEFREYERASTVALEAYVRPLMSRYLDRLERDLPAGCSLRVMKSDGGVISARSASRQAIQTALSGPAAGVIGAFHVASLAGYDHIITLDIGGTSTDVSLCPGMPVLRPEREIDGLPLRVRLLDIETVGAGGGSIARLDAGGALRVGPQSAGADPGPISYGHGGQQITVSDANAILGRLDAAHFLGGRMALDVAAARTALESLAGQMNTTVQAAALGIVQVANVNIDRAIQRVSIARGHDPRDFTLIAFGGAGPLHACEVAERLSIPRVLVPRYPGVLCAFGLLAADIVLDYSQSVLGPLTADTAQRLRTLTEEMLLRAHRDMEREGAPMDRIFAAPVVDLRYQGQAYELPVSMAEADLVAAFHEEHARRYGHAMPERAVEAVTLRVQATSAMPKPPIALEDVIANDGSEALVGQRPEGPGGEPMQLYERERLRPGARFDGPALAFQLDSTVFIAPGWTARVDGYRNLLLERQRYGQ